MKFAFTLFILGLFVSAGLSIAQDISGSKDHPLITRYPGSTIGYYEVQK